MDDALAFTGHGDVTFRDLLTGPAWIWVTAAGDAFMQLVGYRFESGEFVVCGIGFHGCDGSVGWLRKRHQGCVLARHRSRAVARL